MGSEEREPQKIWTQRTETALPFTQYLALISQTYPFHILPSSTESDIPFTHTHYLTLQNQTYPFCIVRSSDR